MRFFIGEKVRLVARGGLPATRGMIYTIWLVATDWPDERVHHVCFKETGVAKVHPSRIRHLTGLERAQEKLK